MTSLKVYTLPEFANLKLPPKRYIIDPFLPERGLIEIYSKTGVGKTTFALSLAMAAASVNGLLALEEKGVTVQRLTDEERAVFRKASLPVYDSDLMSAEDTVLWKKLSDDNC